MTSSDATTFNAASRTRARCPARADDRDRKHRARTRAAWRLLVREFGA